MIIKLAQLHNCLTAGEQAISRQNGIRLHTWTFAVEDAETGVFAADGLLLALLGLPVAAEDRASEPARPSAKLVRTDRPLVAGLAGKVLLLAAEGAGSLPDELPERLMDSFEGLPC